MNIIIRDMAIAWWESKRPSDYSLKNHLSNPCVNCVTTAEKDLAKAIAADLK